MEYPKSNTAMHLNPAQASWKPTIAVKYLDTSALLSMLTMQRDVPGSWDRGYLDMVTDQTRLKIIRPVLTDQVLAEFLNSPVPLTPGHLFEFDDNSNAIGITYNVHLIMDANDYYPKAQERLEWLMDMYNAGALFVETAVGQEYFAALQQHESLARSWERIHKETKKDVRSFNALSRDELEQFLLTPSPEQNAFERSIKKTKLRRDTGEISIADAMYGMQKMRGDDFNKIVLYEGSDVRGHIMQRYGDLCKSGMSSHKGGKRAVAEFDPYDKASFQRKNAAKLGDGSWLTTVGFMAAWMVAANEVDSAPAFLVKPDELKHNWFVSGSETSQQAAGVRDTMNDLLLIVEKSLGKLNSKVVEFGESTRYNAWKDVRFADTRARIKHEHWRASETDNRIIYSTSPYEKAVNEQPQAARNTIVLNQMTRSKATVTALRVAAEQEMVRLENQEHALGTSVIALNSLPTEFISRDAAEVERLKRAIEPEVARNGVDMPLRLHTFVLQRAPGDMAVQHRLHAHALVTMLKDPNMHLYAQEFVANYLDDVAKSAVTEIIKNSGNEPSSQTRMIENSLKKIGLDSIKGKGNSIV